MISEFIIKHRVAVLVAILAVFTLFSLGLLRVSTEVNVANYFIDDGTLQAEQQHLVDTFGNKNFIAVLLQSDNIFSPESLETIEEVGRLLQEKVPLALSVTSITHVDPLLSQGKRIRFEDKKIVSTAEEIAEVENTLDASPSLKGTLFSADKTEAWIIVALDDYPESLDGESNVEVYVGNIAYNALQTLKLPEGITITPTGPAVYAARKLTEMFQDALLVMIIGIVVAVALAIVLFSSFSSVAGILLVLLFSLSSVLSFCGFFGVVVDQAFLAVFSLLMMGVAVGYSVHVHHVFSLKFSEHNDAKKAAVEAINETYKPILYTALTTILALMSLQFIGIRPIRWLGLASSSGLLVVYFLCMTLFPVLLSFDKSTRKNRGFLNNVDKGLERMVMKYATWARKNIRGIIIGTIVLTLIAAYGSSRVRIDFDAVKMTGTRLQHMREQDHVNKAQIGSNDFIDLSIVLEDNDWKKIENIEKLTQLQTFIESLPLVKKTSSFANVISEFNRIKEGSYGVPEDAGKLRWLLHIFGRTNADFLHSWVDKGFKEVRIFIEFDAFSSGAIEKDINEINAYVQQLFPGQEEVHYGGSAYLFVLMNQYVTRGFVKSSFLTVLFITILMIILFRSVRLGLISVIPNLLPLLACGAVLGYAGIPLEFVTMTIAPMILGLSVDDTIHFIFTLKTEYKKSHDYNQAIEKTFKIVGTAISKTTFILTCAFLVFLVSKVNSLMMMGILTTLGITTAYYANVLLTPFLIRSTDAFSKLREVE